MINYTKRLDKALRVAAWAHDKQGQYRKHSDVPYIIHPVGVMMIASEVTADEDVLIGCLLHDILEDVASTIYDEVAMLTDFGHRATGIVKDVTKNESISDWKQTCEAYLEHLEHRGSDEAVIVCAADKIHNLSSILYDYDTIGDNLWNSFTTRNSSDQLWWYHENFALLSRRGAPEPLREQLEDKLKKLEIILDHSPTLK